MNQILKIQSENKLNLKSLKDYFTNLKCNGSFEEVKQIIGIIKTMEQLDLELEKVTRFERKMERANRITKIFNS